jgi:5'-AMP-activated protein kinase catalytic alpha subunit
VWSIGVCLYVMLTGHLPFGNENLTELHALMLDGTYELPDIMSDSLKDLFTRFFQVCEFEIPSTSFREFVTVGNTSC